ncbi:MAG: general secretion pathway protein GspB [Pseudomonadota bacterium]|nr:general secretion pathway protein GspB [Pseudomonadota bacterium]
MSYILDALRKSEQERQRGKVPDIHSAVAEPDSGLGGANVWPWVTVAVVVVSIVVIGIIWVARSPAPGSNISSEPPQQPAVTERASSSTPTPAAVDAGGATATGSGKPAPVMAPTSASGGRMPEYPPVEAPVAGGGRGQAATQSQALSSRAASSPAEPASMAPSPAEDVTGVPPAVGYLPQLEELPAYARDGIPDLTFSSHMYSSMPRFRSVIINGKRLKEGQYLNPELQLREITESGVVMSRDGTLFAVDVLGRWAQ